jgi:alpha-amylase
MLALPSTVFGYLIPLLLTLTPVLSLDNTSIRPRSIYQLLTDRFALPPNASSTTCSTSDRMYCGGTWSGIASKLDYIKGMGFDTIWISPVVSNIGGTTGEGEAYHGYWTLDPSQLNRQYGTEQDLKDLITAVHGAGMYIMVDVVVNHVGEYRIIYRIVSQLSIII